MASMPRGRIELTLVTEAMQRRHLIIIKGKIMATLYARIQQRNGCLIQAVGMAWSTVMDYWGTSMAFSTDTHSSLMDL
jgi:hypothetical protein